MPYDHFQKKDIEEKNTAFAADERQPEAVPGLPNSLIMRVMEEPEAEDEADRLAALDG